MTAARLPRFGDRHQGSVALETVGLLPLLLLAAVMVWQILLVGFTATSAENAARASSRAVTRGDDGVRAGLAALSPWLRDDAEVTLEGTRATVRVGVPIVFPGLSSNAIAISRSVELPD